MSGAVFLMVRASASRYHHGMGIQVTADDMARLRNVLQASRGSTHRDHAHAAELERVLDRADVVAEIAPDVVTMHSMVRVRDLESGKTAVYTLVFPADADIAQRRISVLAPIGTALIGARAGDRIEWRTPGGRRSLQVEAVLYQPETAAAA